MDGDLNLEELTEVCPECGARYRPRPGCRSLCPPCRAVAYRAVPADCDEMVVTAERIAQVLEDGAYDR